VVELDPEFMVVIMELCSFTVNVSHSVNHEIVDTNFGGLQGAFATS
jgi:hypothetical protein